MWKLLIILSAAADFCFFLPPPPPPPPPPSISKQSSCFCFWCWKETFVVGGDFWPARTKPFCLSYSWGYQDLLPYGPSQGCWTSDLRQRQLCPYLAPYHSSRNDGTRQSDQVPRDHFWSARSQWTWDQKRGQGVPKWSRASVKKKLSSVL